MPSLDANKVRERLASLQNKGGKTFEKTDFSKIYWKPKIGSQDIRIVPSKYNKDWPFQEVLFHKDIIKKTMYCLTNFGQKDPIVEFTVALKAEASAKKAKGLNSDEEWNLAKKLRPRTRVFAQVVVRGEEDKGTRLWEFGNEVYEQLLKIAANSDYENFCDIHEGTDLRVEGVAANYAGTDYVKASISPRKKESPITKDETLLKKLLEEQHDPLGFGFQKFSYDQITSYFEQWLNPEGTVDETPVAKEETVDHEDVQEVVAEDIDELPFEPDLPRAEMIEVKKSVTKKKVESVSTPVTSNKDKFKKLFDVKK